MFNKPLQVKSDSCFMSDENKLTPSLLKDPVHFLSFGFGTGYIPKAPGTAGTLVGVALYIPLQFLSDIIYAVVLVMMFLLGCWLCAKTSAVLGTHDHGAIVWDEIVGYLLTMLAAPVGWAWIVLGFLLFRLFDILKPWPISWFDKQVKGGFGIMLDDVIAAIFGLIIIQIIAYFL